MCVAGHTRAVAAAGKLARVQRCCAVADQLLQRGDACLAAAIENVYPHGLHLDGSTRGNQLVRQFMPSRLYRAYGHQHGAMLP